MTFPPMRTITLGIGGAHPLSAQEISQAGVLVQRAQARYTEAGYEVQTVRLSTRPVRADLADWSKDARLYYALGRHRALDTAGLGFCSLASGMAASPDLPLG